MNREWTNRDMEQVVGNLLRVGVMLAAAVVLLGGVLHLVQHTHPPPDYRVFHGEPAELRSIAGILRGALDLRSSAVIQFGLLLLLATPVARVAFYVFAFAAQRDHLYTVITLIVFCVLLFSLLGPHP